MQVKWNKQFTKAVIATTLLAGYHVAAVADVVFTDVASTAVATITEVNPLQITNPGSVLGTGAVAITMNPTQPLTANALITSTLSPRGFSISSTTTHAIETKNTAVGISTSNISIGQGAIVQTLGAAAAIKDSAANIGNLVVIKNSGTIRNANPATSVDNKAFFISNTNSIVVIANSSTGSILGGPGAIAIDIDNMLGAGSPAITNSGTIISNGNSAIRANTVNIPFTQSSGLTSGKNVVIDYSTTAGNITLNGGSIVATDGNTANAITTTGLVTITGGSVTGVIKSTAAGNGGINFTLARTAQFTTNGNLDANNAAGRVLVNSGTLNLRHNIIDSGAVGGGSLTVIGGASVNINDAARTIAGNLLLGGANTQNAKMVFEIKDSNFTAANSNVIASSSYGKLTIGAGGASSLENGNIQITNPGNGYIANGTVFTVLDNQVGFASTKDALITLPNGNSTITGASGVVGNTGLYTFTGSINNNNVTVKVDRKSMASLEAGSRVNGLIRGVATVLENIGQQSNAFGATVNPTYISLLGELGRLPDSTSVANALTQLVSNANGIVVQGAQNNLNNSLKVISNRITIAQLEEGSADVSGYAAGGVSNSDRGVWGQWLLNQATQKKRKGLFGYRSESLGFSMGTDMMVTEKARAGVAFSYASNDSNTRNIPRNNLKTRSYLTSFYGSKDAGCGWWEWMLSYAHLTHVGLRNVSIGAVTATMANRHAGNQMGARAGYGYLDSAFGLDLAKSIYLDWNRVMDKTYSEKGPTVLNLRVAKHTVDRLALGMDMKANTTWHHDLGKFVPNAHLGMEYALVQDRERISANFVGGPAFNIIGVKPSRYGVNAGAGIAFVSHHKTTVGVNYDVQLKQDYYNHMGHMTVRYDF